ncbi:MAG: hypothetical protein IKN12_09445 [Selenomonadaceae bacterium]|nr:hypothetical protein [Selenomonadaceae bacterium]
MKIAEIRSALASRAQAMNISPIKPIEYAPTTSGTVLPFSNTKETVANEAQTPSVSVKEEKKSNATRKASSKNPKTGKSSSTTDIEEIIAKYLKLGIDYDKIPGCGQKAVLLKAGAEHLAEIMGFRTTIQVINRVEDFTQKFVLYEVQISVLNGDGKIIAEGLGSCNSKERKYLKGDFATQLNTVLKMAKKRAYVDAILSATGSSRIFTQDIDEVQNYIHLVEKE